MDAPGGSKKTSMDITACWHREPEQTMRWPICNLIPSEDIAVAVLVNTYTDGAGIVDEVLAALLPEYKKNLAAAASAPVPPPAPQSPPAEVPSEMVGSWTGFVGTYKGKVPLTVTIDATGHLVAKLAEQPEVSVARARWQ